MNLFHNLISHRWRCPKIEVQCNRVVLQLHPHASLHLARMVAHAGHHHQHHHRHHHPCHHHHLGLAGTVTHATAPWPRTTVRPAPGTPPPSSCLTSPACRYFFLHFLFFWWWQWWSWSCFNPHPGWPHQLAGICLFCLDDNVDNHDDHDYEYNDSTLILPDLTSLPVFVIFVPWWLSWSWSW